jgi:4-amino-4-deoxychorismate lyase
MEYFLYNQSIIPTDTNPIPLKNRAFLYGDGIFETIIVKEGRILYLSDHLERMERGLNALFISKPSYFTPDFISKNLNALANKNQLGSSFRLRMNIWRKDGGLYTPEVNEGELMITTDFLAPFAEARKQVYFFEGIKKSFSIISPFKTLNAAPYVVASIEKVKSGAEDMILLDINNNISECTASNIFFIKDNTLFTPSLECACIDGIARKQILKICRQHGILIETGKYGKTDVLLAEFVFTSNVSGIIPIRKVEGMAYPSNHSLFDDLAKWLKSHQMATEALIWGNGS